MVAQVRVLAWKLEGNQIVLVGDPDRPAHTFSFDFVQGGCPLRMARDLENLAIKIRETAHAMGATAERR